MCVCVCACVRVCVRVRVCVCVEMRHGQTLHHLRQNDQFKAQLLTSIKHRIAFNYSLVL